MHTVRLEHQQTVTHRAQARDVIAVVSLVDVDVVVRRPRFGIVGVRPPQTVLVRCPRFVGVGNPRKVVPRCDVLGLRHVAARPERDPQIGCCRPVPLEAHLVVGHPVGDVVHRHAVHAAAVRPRSDTGQVGEVRRRTVGDLRAVVDHHLIGAGVSVQRPDALNVGTQRRRVPAVHAVALANPATRIDQDVEKVRGFVLSQIELIGTKVQATRESLKGLEFPSGRSHLQLP